MQDRLRDVRANVDELMREREADRIRRRDQSARETDFREAPADAQTITTVAHTVSVPQLDLLAMQHGWTMTTYPTGYDGWTGVQFERGCVDA